MAIQMIYVALSSTNLPSFSYLSYFLILKLKCAFSTFPFTYKAYCFSLFLV